MGIRTAIYSSISDEPGIGAFGYSFYQTPLLILSHMKGMTIDEIFLASKQLGCFYHERLLDDPRGISHLC